jgi:hypothetical protein
MIKKHGKDTFNQIKSNGREYTNLLSLKKKWQKIVLWERTIQGRGALNLQPDHMALSLTVRNESNIFKYH